VCVEVRELAVGIRAARRADLGLEIIGRDGAGALSMRRLVATLGSHPLSYEDRLVLRV
jgi:hypothetical protein